MTPIFGKRSPRVRIVSERLVRIDAAFIPGEVSPLAAFPKAGAVHAPSFVEGATMSMVGHERLPSFLG